MSNWQLTDLMQRPSAPQREQGSTYWRDLDWVLLIAAACVTLYGALLVWSGSLANYTSGGDTTSFVKKHLITVLASIPMGYVASRLNHRWLRAYTPYLYAICLAFMLAPFIPHLGARIAGARAWVSLPGGFTLQPSEFMTIALILAMSAVLSEKRDIESEPNNRDVRLALLLAVIPLLIDLAQNDTGTSLIMATVVVAVIAVSGAKRSWVVGLLALGIGGGLLAARLHLLKTHQIARLTSFVNPGSDTTGSAYNALQARIAIGGGQVTGYGLFHGPQTQGHFVPVNVSDFVFTVSGEEMGFLGSILLLILLAVIVWRALLIAFRADDLYGRLVATGITAWFAFQIFENIGMTMGIMPITGIPLPLVSAGGTSMMATWIGIGLLMNIRLHAVRSAP